MSRPIRVLLVEDNPGDVDLIRDSLQTATPRLDITVVGDGAEAVDYLFHRHQYSDDIDAPLPDFVLLDLNLPKLSGHEVLKEARKSTDLRTLPIIIITSSDSQPDIVMSYALGANCYVTKPGELDAFQSTMRAVGDFWCRVAKLP